MIKKNILITGGTGSLGKALVARWYPRHRITVLSRNPHNQEQLEKQFPDLRFILSDICNIFEVRRACRGQDILIHAAAIKQVNSGEYHPAEFSRVNVIGTQTVANAWLDTRHLTHLEYSYIPPEPRRAIFISSDKACMAINAYGNSKAIGEAIFRKAGFSVLRYGNVVESRGAFLQFWKEALERGDPLTLREPEPTRFFLTLDQAVELVRNVLHYLEAGNPDGIFIPRNLPAFSVWDVAVALKTETETEPLLPYEKRHERLLADGEVAVPLSQKLARIEPGWEERDPVGRYLSDRAPRMTGEEFLEAVGWHP